MDTCRYCPHEFDADALTAIAHLRTHAGVFAEQGQAESKLLDLDRWERNEARHRALMAETHDYHADAASTVTDDPEEPSAK